MDRYSNRTVIINRYRNPQLDAAAKIMKDRCVPVRVLRGINTNETYETPRVIITEVFSEQEIGFCMNAGALLRHKPFFIMLSPYSSLIHKYGRVNDPHFIFMLEPAEPRQIADAVSGIPDRKVTIIVF